MPRFRGRNKGQIKLRGKKIKVSNLSFWNGDPIVALPFPPKLPPISLSLFRKRSQVWKMKSCWLMLIEKKYFLAFSFKLFCLLFLLSISICPNLRSARLSTYEWRKSALLCPPPTFGQNSTLFIPPNKTPKSRPSAAPTKEKTRPLCPQPTVGKNIPRSMQVIERWPAAVASQGLGSSAGKTPPHKTPPASKISSARSADPPKISLPQSTHLHHTHSINHFNKDLKKWYWPSENNFYI